MGKTNAFRPETIIQRIENTVPAANTDYTVKLPAGAYYVMISVNSSVTGTTTTIGSIRKFVDDAQTAINPINLRMLDVDDTGYNTTVLTMGAGAQVETARVFDLNGSSTTPVQPVMLPHGLRISVVKGGATTGEKLEIEVIASRIA